MMYPYMTLAEETEIVHSQTGELPDYKWTERQGYSDEEIAMFEELLHSNAHLLYRYAENGGIGVKKDGQK